LGLSLAVYKLLRGLFMEEINNTNNNQQLYKFLINGEIFQENLTYSETENLYYNLIDSGYIRIEKQ
jgi:hypothetical protein